MDRTEIARLLPHGESFIFVDEVVEITPLERIVALCEALDLGLRAAEQRRCQGRQAKAGGST